MCMVESINFMGAFTTCSRDEHILKKKEEDFDDNKCCANTLWSYIQS